MCATELRIPARRTHGRCARKRWWLALFVAGARLLPRASTWAQEDDPVDDGSRQEEAKPAEAPAEPTAGDTVISDEIVVTARKREEVLEDVPIAITLVTGERLQEADITELAHLAPNFHHSEDVNSSDRFIGMAWARPARTWASTRPWAR